MAPMTRLDKTVWVSALAPRLWLHTTTNAISEGFYYPANGVIYERKSGSVLIDAGYRPDQAETLLEWSKRNLASPISLAFATHFHNDRVGGIPALERHGIPTVAHPLTSELARLKGLPVPQPIRDFKKRQHRLTDGCELCFPGAGHTRDNCVVWFPHQRVLFGGCFLKSVTSDDLGNLADSVLRDWTSSIHLVREAYPNPRIVVPGHGTIAGDSIGTTSRLITEAQPR
jgi:glyoxylase-like metal-dependent hydrolase (beta-lactamase superfamily II)